MSLPYTDQEIGVLLSPFQSMVHDPFFGVWMKASVRYLAPDSADSAAGLPAR